MSQLSSAEYLKKFSATLKERRALPRNIQLSHVGPVKMASVFDSAGSNIITESVFTGMHVDPNIAVLKGLVEMIERKTFGAGRACQHPACLTERSDGFAAFPTGLIPDTCGMARNNALHEAIERYVWATWWDNSDYGHESSNVASPDFSGPLNDFVLELERLVPISSMSKITPKLANLQDVNVIIFFAFLEPYGVISGGACGRASDTATTEFRALCELARHGLAIRRIKEKNLSPQTFYEKRLAFFGLTTEGEKAAEARINNAGQLAIELPNLKINQQVPHPLDDLVIVHRCYFENQPPFVGGKLERLCL